VRRHRIPHDELQYHGLSSEHVRSTLLQLCLEFVRATRDLPGIRQIALIGSLATPKLRPKDADLIVIIDANLDLAPLAAAARRFQGRAQGINSTADVFLCDEAGYLGRVCHYRKCHPRARCLARHCGRRQHLNDDLDIVTLDVHLIFAPAVIIHPVIMFAAPIPTDVDDILLKPLSSAREAIC
jgi:hypothetical protein